MRSLELELERLLTTGTFNLIVKDPIADPHWAALSASDDTNPAIRAVVLETFQTYYAFSAAVNPSTKMVIREHPALNAVIASVIHHGSTEGTEQLKSQEFRVCRVSVVNRS